MTRLLPINRSITGDGLRATLAVLAERIPLELTEIPTGTQILDWTVPREWNLREAWIADPSGRRVVDLADSTLHVMGYSVPVRGRFSRAALGEHLFSLPEHPEWIPYRTSYWEPAWGFCLSERRLATLGDGEYEVCIDAELGDGSMTYAECRVPGRAEETVLVSCHACHPSLCNDNLSGVVLAATLARYLSQSEGLRHSYRFLFGPGTIGPLAWLARNEPELDRIAHGLVAYCVGDPGPLIYKRSRRGDAEVDRAAAIALRDSGARHAVRDFVPWGGDERQFCSPGFDLPVGALTRTPPGEYAENHTSADDPGLVRPEALADSLAAYVAVLDVLETNRTYRSLNPRGEPQLGRRGLYRGIGGVKGGQDLELALLWVLSMADGAHTLLDIAERSSVPFARVRTAAGLLHERGLLEDETPRAPRGPVAPPSSGLH